MRQRLTALIIAGLLVLLALPAATTAAECQFILGFATLKALIDAAEGPDKVGDCLENQRFNPENGDALQQTTGGLLVWRKADNWTAFTDGYRTWINGPYGLQARLNTEQFDWEGPAEANSGLVADSTVLLEARRTLAGSATLNWNADRPITEWDGVIVSGSPRRVTALELSERQLTGTIPPQLGSLIHLERLVLSHNKLTGIIPPELGALSRLQHLDLGFNQLTGRIPHQLGSLASLQELWLHINQLTGPIPPKLGALSQLRELSIGFNQLSGPIPPELGTLSRLEVVGLHVNQLTGPVPPELGALTKLSRLYLRDNALTGCLPPPLRRVATNDLDKLGLPFCGTTPQAVPTPILTPTPYTGDWVQYTHTDPLTDEQAIGIWLRSFDYRDGYLHVRCRYNQPEGRRSVLEVFIDWNADLGSEARRQVLTRVDEQEVLRNQWSRSTDAEATFAPWPAVRDRLIKDMKRASRFVARVVKQDETTITAQWNVAGFTAAVKPVEARCSR